MSKMDIYLTDDNTVVRIDNGDGTHTAVYFTANHEAGVTRERMPHDIAAWDNRGEPVWTAPKPKRYTVDGGPVSYLVIDPEGRAVGSSLSRDNAQKIADALNAQEGL